MIFLSIELRTQKRKTFCAHAHTHTRIHRWIDPVNGPLHSDAVRKKIPDNRGEKRKVFAFSVCSSNPRQKCHLWTRLGPVQLYNMTSSRTLVRSCVFLLTFFLTDKELRTKERNRKRGIYAGLWISVWAKARERERLLQKPPYFLPPRPPSFFILPFRIFRSYFTSQRGAGWVDRPAKSTSFHMPGQPLQRIRALDLLSQMRENLSFKKNDP